MQRTLSVIDLRAIRQNALKIKSILNGKKFFAVVKADAYGHGAEEVARYIEDIVDGFCVAIIDEGVSLRVAGISKPILVFAPPLDMSDALRAMHYSLDVTVSTIESARLSKGNFCHIKVNTGMNRSGCNLSFLKTLLAELDLPNVRGVYSHMYAPERSADSKKQLSLFNSAEEVVKSACPQAFSHFAASGGILRGGGFLKDGARCGILLYGYAPTGFERAGFKPALKVYAKRTQVTNFIGGGIGYSRAEKNYGKLSVYRLGYADGFSRTVPLGEKTLCMDAFVRDGGGEDLLVFADADEYARRVGTISYEVLCNVTRRSQRVYLR